MSPLALTSRLVSPLLNLFGLQLIDVGKPIVGTPKCPQDFIELRVDGLGVAVPGALNKKRHKPGRERCDTMPVQTLSVESKPENGKNSPDEERYRPICSFANARESFSQSVTWHETILLRFPAAKRNQPIFGAFWLRTQEREERLWIGIESEAVGNNLAVKLRRNGASSQTMTSRR
jgi:hypothetical protein